MDHKIKENIAGILVINCEFVIHEQQYVRQWPMNYDVAVRFFLRSLFYDVVVIEFRMLFLLDSFGIWFDILIAGIA